jgi:resolvase-like protein
MPHNFAYLRVSTANQTTDNQLQEIKTAGFKVESRRVVTETVSGNIATSQRRGFTRLLDRLEAGEVLVVTKLAGVDELQITVEKRRIHGPLDRIKHTVAEGDQTVGGGNRFAGALLRYRFKDL